MLRITTIRENGSPVTLKLEGKISAEWVALLERECRTWMTRQHHVVLDMADVTYLDDRGVSLLRSLPLHQVTLVHHSDFIEELLDKGATP